MFRIAAAAITLFFTATSLAELTAMTSFRDEFVRISDVNGAASIETFTLADRIRSMHKDESGNVYAVGRAVNGSSPLYLVENAVSGTPSLTFLSDLGFNYAATVRKGDQVFAFNTEDEVWSLDVSNLPTVTESLIGNTGIPINGQEIAAAGIDLENDILYGGSSDWDALYRINQATGAATLIGDLLGVGNTVNSIGMDYEDGALYATISNRLNDRREFGTVDTQTGAFTSLIDLGPRDVGSIVSIGMVVVPEPATMALLSFSFLWLRRR